MITHDLSQIAADDFVYVMADGVVAEQGFRLDLMKKTPLYGQAWGIFAGMAAEQAVEPLAPKMDAWQNGPGDEEVLETEKDADFQEYNDTRRPTSTLATALRPSSVMYLDILDDYVLGGRSSIAESKRESQRLSRSLSNAQKRLSWSPQDLDIRRRGSWRSVISDRPLSRLSHDQSFQTPVYIQTNGDKRTQLKTSEKDSVNVLCYADQQARKPSEHDDNYLKSTGLTVAMSTLPTEPPKKIRGVFASIIHFYPTLPSKWLLVLGILGSVAHGVTTPIWASYLTKLMQIVGAGGVSPSLTEDGLIVLGLCAAQAMADTVCTPSPLGGPLLSGKQPSAPSFRRTRRGLTIVRTPPRDWSNALLRMPTICAL